MIGPASPQRLPPLKQEKLSPEQKRQHLVSQLPRLEALADSCRRAGWSMHGCQMLEKRLVSLVAAHGPDAEEVWEACKELVTGYNQVAMTELRGAKQAGEVLQRAVDLTAKTSTNCDDPERTTLRAISYNNMACFYRREAALTSGARRVGRLGSARHWLEKALRLEENMSGEQDADTAGTHLNLCAVLSELGRHKDALNHAQVALIVLQSEFLGADVPQGTKSGETLVKDTGPMSRVATLAVCYHNVGVELEFEYRGSEAADAFQKGLDIAGNHLGALHPITMELKRAMLAAQDKYHRELQKKRWKKQKNESAMLNRKVATPNANAFQYENPEFDIIVHIQAVYRGILTRRRLREGLIVPPGPIGEMVRERLSGETETVTAALSNLMQRAQSSRDRGFSGSMLQGREELQPLVSEARELVGNLRSWRRLQRTADDLEQLIRATEQVFEPTERELELARQEVVREMESLFESGSVGEGVIEPLVLPTPKPTSLELDSRGVVVGSDGAPPNLTEAISARQLVLLQSEVHAAIEPLGLVAIAGESAYISQFFATEAEVHAMRNRAEMARSGLLALFAVEGAATSAQVQSMIGTERIQQIQAFLAIDTSLVQVVEEQLVAARAELDSALAVWKMCERPGDTLEARDLVLQARAKYQQLKDAASAPADRMQLALSRSQLERYDGLLRALGPLHARFNTSRPASRQASSSRPVSRQTEHGSRPISRQAGLSSRPVSRQHKVSRPPSRQLPVSRSASMKTAVDQDITTLMTGLVLAKEQLASSLSSWKVTEDRVDILAARERVLQAKKAVALAEWKVSDRHEEVLAARDRVLQAREVLTSPELLEARKAVALAEWKASETPAEVHAARAQVLEAKQLLGSTGTLQAKVARALAEWKVTDSGDDVLGARDRVLTARTAFESSPVRGLVNCNEFGKPKKTIEELSV